MITNILAYSLCAACPQEAVYDASIAMHSENLHLSEQERERIWREIHFAIKKMNVYMDKAYNESERINDINIRSATKSVVQGCICGLTSCNCYGIVIAGCLGGLSDIAGNYIDSFMRVQDYVQEAATYARIADDLQDRLWYDR